MRPSSYGKAPDTGRGGSITRLLEGAVRAGCFPGCVAGIECGAGDRQPLIVGAGRTRVGPSGVQPSAHTLYDLASLTKPLVVLTLFLLARRDDPRLVQRSIGDFVDGLGHWAGVSFGALLTHTSGMPAWVPLYAFGIPPENPSAIFSRVEPVARPGQRCIYSCPGFILLGMALERIFQERLDVLFRRKIAEPLGVETELMFQPPDVDLSRTAGGSNAPAAETALAAREGFDPATIPPNGPGLPDDGNARFFGGVAGNAGLFGSITGVLTLARSYLDGGTGFLRDEEIGFVRTLRTAGMEQHRSLGWQVASSPGCSAGRALNPGAIGHTGFTGPSIWIDYDRRRTFVLLANRHHPRHRVENNLHPFRRRFHSLAADSLETVEI